MHLEAHAKINPVLAITGIRDGYHLLDTVMLETDLTDTVTAEKADGISVSMEYDPSLGLMPSIPQESNIAYKAARTILPPGLGAEIHIYKRIPSEAGMGGGSSDAGAVLKMLNELYGLGYAKDGLMRLGLSLGADVPFAVAGGAARVTGIGEYIEPIEPVSYELLLVKPDRGINTRAAFAAWDNMKERLTPSVDGFLRAYFARDFDGIGRYAKNALYPPALSELPVLGDIREKLLSSGARAAFMTGSGSAMIGLYETAAARDSAYGAFDGMFIKKMRTAAKTQ